MPRQAVYACLTCTPQGEAGVCYSCSIRCHGSHNVVELFQKRNFVCDCGNRKFREPCTLLSVKEPTNPSNTYNHNYVGRYCRCDTFYDPEKEESTMHQCALCEDWFHARCLAEVGMRASWPTRAPWHWPDRRVCTRSDTMGRGGRGGGGRAANADAGAVIVCGARVRHLRQGIPCAGTPARSPRLPARACARGA